MLKNYKHCFHDPAGVGNRSCCFVGAQTFLDGSACFSAQLLSYPRGRRIGIASALSATACITACDCARAASRKAG